MEGTTDGVSGNAAAGSGNDCPNPNSNSSSTAEAETSSQSSPGTTPNAFALLMQNSSSEHQKKKRKRPESPDNRNSNNGLVSRFVSCPMGCGKHILRHSINAHLDVCLGRKKKSSSSPSLNMVASSQPNNYNHHPPKQSITTPSQPTKEQSDLEWKNLNIESSSMKGTSSGRSVSTAVDSSVKRNIYNVKGDYQAEDATAIAAGSSSSKTDNVFAHMMKKSAEVFSDRTTSPKRLQRMHLHENGTVSVTCYTNSTARDLLPQQQQPMDQPLLGTVAWSCTIQVRKTVDMDLPVELNVSTSILPLHSDHRRRFVQHHSRLSVPVLKSILQKSIRRRKPLPSVRVAMELSDKSLADLLRRLAIVVLEDSTLHPDLPLLVWLMMASSKDYGIPLSLMKRVFGIVYEMASCPWRDPLNNAVERKSAESPSTANHPPKLSFPSITCFRISEEEDNNSNTTSSVQLTAENTLIWAMLMRSNYGGMAGDIRMLKAYAALWQDRFQTSILPEATAKRLASRCPNATTIDSWKQVPAFIHQVAAKQSKIRIESIVTSSNNGFLPGLPRLSMTDVTMEGVDFHCSSVLKSAILDHSSVVQECLDCLKALDLPPTIAPLPNQRDEQLEWLEGILKSCMWNFIAGVNLRQSLVVPSPDKPLACENNDKEEPMKRFWTEHVLPRTKAFSERYVRERLAS